MIIIKDLLLPLVLSSLAGLSSLLGYFIIFFKIKNIDRFISFTMSLSLSIMLSLSVFDLIPTSIKYMNSTSMLFTTINVFIFLLVGYFLVKVLDKIIIKKGRDELYKLGLFNFIVLTLHNLPEGILTFFSTYQDIRLGLSIFLGISLHNIPEGISIAIPIYYSKKSKWKAFKIVFLSGICEPLGGMILFLLFRNYITYELISIILLIVSGIMITVSINKMYPEVIKLNNKKSMVYGLIIGLLISLLNLLLS